MTVNTWKIYLHIVPTENNNEAIKLILLPNTPSKLVASLKSRTNRIALLSFSRFQVGGVGADNK